MNIFHDLICKKRISFCSIALAILIFLTPSAVPQQPAPPIQWPTLRELLESEKSATPLEQAGLASSELKDVRSALAAIANSKSCQDAAIQGCGALQSEVVGKVQINTQGAQAIVLRSKADCGTLGCPIWIVQITPAVRTLLEDFGWGFAILPSNTQGYFDVVTAAGNHDNDLFLYRMKGSLYRRSRSACLIPMATNDQPAAGTILEHPCPPSSR